MFGFKVLRWKIGFAEFIHSRQTQNDYLDLHSVIAFIKHKYSSTMGNTRSVIDPESLKVGLSVFDNLNSKCICRHDKKCNTNTFFLLNQDVHFKRGI